MKNSYNSVKDSSVGSGGNYYGKVNES